MAIADRCPVCGGVLLDNPGAEFMHKAGCMLQNDSRESVVREGHRKDIMEKMEETMKGLRTTYIESLKDIRKTIRRARIGLR